MMVWVQEEEEVELNWQSDNATPKKWTSVSFRECELPVHNHLSTSSAPTWTPSTLPSTCLLENKWPPTYSPRIRKYTHSVVTRFLENVIILIQCRFTMSRRKFIDPRGALSAASDPRGWWWILEIFHSSNHQSIFSHFPIDICFH